MEDERQTLKQEQRLIGTKVQLEHKLLISPQRVPDLIYLDKMEFMAKNVVAQRN